MVGPHTFSAVRLRRVRSRIRVTEKGDYRPEVLPRVKGSLNGLVSNYGEGGRGTKQGGGGAVRQSFSHVEGGGGGIQKVSTLKKFWGGWNFFLHV